MKALLGREGKSFTFSNNVADHALTGDGTGNIYSQIQMDMYKANKIADTAIAGLNVKEVADPKNPAKPDVAATGDGTGHTYTQQQLD